MSQYDTREISMLLHGARKQLKKAHQIPETWTEDIGHTAKAIDSLGIQHYGRGGEDIADRTIEAQARAMADLTFVYCEQVYKADEDKLTFFDKNERDRFDDLTAKAHDKAMTALQKVEIDE